MSKSGRHGGPLRVAILVLIAVIIYISTRGRDRTHPSQPANAITTSPIAIAEIDPLVRPPQDAQHKDGIAAAVLVDTSGSMQETVPDAGGGQRPKIEIARRCVLDVVRQAAGFAKAQPDLPTLMGIYEFSGRNGQDPCRQIVPLKAPDVAGAQAALAKLAPGGDTPIGDAIIAAKHDLDATGLSRLHILIVTDGENTDGHTPGDVVTAISRLPEEQRPGIYFIAFDVNAKVFDAAKNAGATVLGASNEKELHQTLELLMSNQILLEK